MTSLLLEARASRVPWLYPLVYLSVTYSTTALLVAVGLFGDPVMAADIAIVHGATVATFYAFSANTRNLVLGRSGAVSLRDILRMRLMLAAPLTVVAYLLATAGTSMAAWLASALVARRCVEWFNELQLNRAELEHKTGFVLGFLLLQSVLFVAAAVALVTESHLAPLALAGWALVPLGLAFPLHKILRDRPVGPFVPAFRRLLPHTGATAVSGMALFAFRVLVVLLLAKELAGDLFTAIAIGSFAGTLFANVVGPSIELHAQRTGQGMPRQLTLALAITLIAGLALTVAALVSPSPLLAFGKTKFFWVACGLSLIGGVVMVLAQQIRLRVLRADDGRDVFGPEVLVHMVLLVATPALILVGGPTGATTLYLLSAVLAYVFYRSSELAPTRIPSAAHPVLDRLRFSIAFLLVFPLFFQLAGRIFNSKQLMIDSGGALLVVPLPVSLAACLVGIVFLADYRRATRSFWVVLLLFASMLLSVVATTPADTVFERAKLLMLVQVLLPALGLILGEMIEPPTRARASTVGRAFFWACAIIMPAQLVASWLQGYATLTQWLWLFSVYQHLQYVPVVLACAALMAAPELWRDSAYRPWVFPLLTVSVIYCLAAYSLLAIFIATVGLVLFAARYLPSLGARRGFAIAAAALLAIGTQLVVLMDTPTYRASAKLVPYASLVAKHSIPCTDEDVRFNSPNLAWDQGACVAKGGELDPQEVLVELHPRLVRKGDKLSIEGEVHEGGISVALVQTSAHIALQRSVERPGPFRIELYPEDGTYIAVVANYTPPGSKTAIVIKRIAWQGTSSVESIVRETGARGDLARFLPLNLVERVGDWILFGVPIFTSAQTFLVGHPKPFDRAVRTSPHNYYIDLAYNFGIVALLPVIGLIAYTARLVWIRRREVLRADELLWLTGVVFFLVLIDSNFKVSLRQPYPGIFAFFAWGVLLARLHGLGAPERNPLHSAGRTTPAR